MDPGGWDRIIPVWILNHPMADPVPPIGLGTSGNDDFERCAETVRTALEVGYRHIDTAQMYGNERAVGAGLARAEVPREEVVLATKVHPTNLAGDDVTSTTRESLEKLGVDAVDLLYVHWPTDAYEPTDTLPAFDVLYDEGLVRHVAVSNFTVPLLEEARRILDAPIVANQVEVHPLLPPRPELLAYCSRHDIDVVAYSPFCRGEALDLPVVRTVADRHGVSPARAILAWLLARDLHPIPKAVGAAHLRDNYAALGLDLPEQGIESIDGVDRRYRRFDRPGTDWTR